MSDKNPERNRSARERLAQQREKEKGRERRRRTLIVSSAVVGVLALAAVVGLIAANAGRDTEGGSASGPAVAPSGAIGEDSLTLPVGASDAPSTLTIWEDFRCPVCAQFENAFRATIAELADSGQIRVEYHLATIIDGNLGGSGSLRAANAAACAQGVGEFAPYHDVLYRNQPPEADDAFGKNSRLIELAGEVKGLDTPGFRSCVESGEHDSWVGKSDAAFREGGFQGTPTVLLNGESVFPSKGGQQISPENLKKWVAEANKGKKAGTATPSAPGASPAPSASSGAPSAPGAPPAPGASTAPGTPSAAVAVVPGTAP
ncbi:Serine/threonine-protein kinase PknE [Streptomyces sp. ADI96-02]|uniref:DsbA family protein n=1 Tax=unclassified Streptomyces TaxID=2593676 RepID=UPI000F5506AF|nr:thioredoxin domain-containing protein [Streptomyces sp. ADI96-02]RPK66517.1 Serine/threonine-protein kinase PknE [Streptomyces sp. ADI96-02]